MLIAQINALIVPLSRMQRTLLCAFFCLLVGGTTHIFADTWTAFRGGESRTGFYPNKLRPPDTTAAPEWVTKLGGMIISSPVVSNGLVFVGARDSNIYAIDIQTGEVLWKKHTGGWVDATPLVYQDKIIVPSRDGFIYTYVQKTGEELSKIVAGTQLSSPAIYHNELVISGLGPPVNAITAHSLNKTTGALNSEVSSLALPQMCYSSPAISGDWVVIGANNGKLYGFSLQNDSLEKKWEVQTEGGVYLSTPAIVDTVVYFAPGNADRSVYAIALHTGAIMWKSTGTSLAKGVAKVGTEHVFENQQITQLMRLSPADRKVYFDHWAKRGFGWSLSPVAKRTGLAKVSQTFGWQDANEVKTSSVAIGKSYVWVVQKQLGYAVGEDLALGYQPRFVLMALDKKNGAPVWSFEDAKNSERLGYAGSPLVAEHADGGELVVFGWGEGSIYAVHSTEKETKVVWAKKLAGDVISSPAVSNEKMFVATTEGNLYAFKLQEIADTKTFSDSSYFYPNPVRGSAQEAYFQFDNSVKLDVELVIYNAAERPVFRANFTREAGETKPYIWRLDEDFANGVYFAKASARNVSTGQKLSKWFKIALMRK